MSDDPRIFIHEKGICESASVGDGTRIWAFAHVLAGAKIGRNCNICDHVFIENDVVVGDDVTIKSGVQLWDGLRVGNKVFIGPNATFTNDIFPRSKEHPSEYLKTAIEDGASIGANATILPGVRIGTGAMIGAGAVVTKSVPDNAIVVGNPAIIVGYQSAKYDGEMRAGPAALSPSPGSRARLGVGDSELWRLPHFSDLRGHLYPLEFRAGSAVRSAADFPGPGRADQQGERRACSSSLPSVSDRGPWPGIGRGRRRPGPPGDIVGRAVDRPPCAADDLVYPVQVRAGFRPPGDGVPSVRCGGLHPRLWRVPAAGGRAGQGMRRLQALEVGNGAARGRALVIARRASR